MAISTPYTGASWGLDLTFSGRECNVTEISEGKLLVDLKLLLIDVQSVFSSWPWQELQLIMLRCE